MGRKNLSEERKNQLIDAFEECIIKYGLAEATLQRIAETANVNLGTIHHYIGNRDNLLEAMLQRFTEKAKKNNNLLLKVIPAKIHLEYLLEHIFKTEDQKMDQILSELFSASEHNSIIKQLLNNINNEYLKLISKELGNLNSDLDATEKSDIAYFLLALSYGSDILDGIGISKKEKSLIKLSKILMKNIKSR
jgi:AcrR family transcriptional regulator